MPTGRRPVIMVVEDDHEMNHLERQLLELHGLDTFAAYTGTEALDLAQRRQADAVLLDIMLPEMDGFETCRRLRLINDGKPPVVILSALDNEDCRRRGYEVGASAYFSKPFDPDELVNTLRSLIEQNGNPGRQA